MIQKLINKFVLILGLLIMGAYGQLYAQLDLQNYGKSTSDVLHAQTPPHNSLADYSISRADKCNFTIGDKVNPPAEIQFFEKEEEEKENDGLPVFKRSVQHPNIFTYLYLSLAAKYLAYRCASSSWLIKPVFLLSYNYCILYSVFRI